jgi:hypothetical protein
MFDFIKERKSDRDPPMTLANAARVRLTGWKACQHQVERDPIDIAARYDAETTLLDWRERLSARNAAAGSQVWDHGRRRIALVAPTAADARDVIVEGESGLLNIGAPRERPYYEPSKRRLT